MIRRLLCILYVILIATPVWAQAKGEQKGAIPGRFDFYVLALSWSPTYCANGGDKRSTDQCHIGAMNDFVVHGLWPQFESGYPTECPSDEKALPKTTLEAASHIFPDIRLADHEWKRHGSCTARAPAEYLADIATARQHIEAELQEVRICFTKDLKGFRACPELEGGSCRAASVKVLPVH
ncbi:MAG: ribonuclease T [Alphaproteobacteria bacterium]|nr:ribonuclease T [Alphaproteobacteria bacterium]